MLHLHSVILFLFNNHNFVEDVWGGTHLEKHLGGKLEGFVERHGNLGGMVSFLAELDSENLKKIEEYIKEKHPSHYYKEVDEFDKACERAGHYLSNDASEIPAIIKGMMEMEDDTQMIDDSSDEIVVWEKVTNSFSVQEFLEMIGL